MLRWTVLLLACCPMFSSGDYPANEYVYSLRREQLFEAELAYEGKKNDLSQDEQLVDHYLQHLKWDEFEKTKSRFLPSISINETTIEDTTNSEVYRALHKLPKGGSMHSHENHELGKRKLLEIVFNSTDFQYLWLSDPEKNTPRYSWKLQFGKESPDGDRWIKVKGSNYTLEDILQHQTLLGVMSDFARANPTNSGQRWLEMGPLWGRASVLIDNIEIKKEYLKAMYQKNLDEGVQYLETRKGVGGYSMYRVDPNVTENNGIVNLENEHELGELEINITLEVVAKFIEDNPSFIGHKRITYSSRKVSEDAMETNMENAIRLHKKYPDHLLGFDMVGEEDAGKSHIFFLKEFMKQYDENTKESKIPFYQHTAETNWPKDLIASTFEDDPVATIQNAYEAILLGSKRVGHGLGYIKHPYLIQLLKKQDVAVEICPLSNQILGYIADLRNHPAINYIRNGVPVVLGSDDPGTFGYDHFTLDWYAIFMAWGLDLNEMKQLSMRALNYSGMSNDEKAAAMTKFGDAWNKYIADTKTIACGKTYGEIPFVGRLLPREGLKSGGTKVHVFGRMFDKTISLLCQNKKAQCKFGEKESDVVYISNSHLVCEAPAQDQASDGSFSVSVSVSLEDGVWIDTNQNFTYTHDRLISSVPPTVSSCSLIFYNIMMLVFIKMVKI